MPLYLIAHLFAASFQLFYVEIELFWFLLCEPRGLSFSTLDLEKRFFIVFIFNSFSYHSLFHVSPHFFTSVISSNDVCCLFRLVATLIKETRRLPHNFVISCVTTNNI